MAVVPDGASALSVMSVKAGGPAEAAGVVAGDKITTIDGHTVAELTPIQSALFLASGHIGIGETVSLGVQHASGDPTTVSITSVKW
jgi:S1-C subfamily serine protease